MSDPKGLVGVVLIDLGGPASLDEVKGYLTAFFSSPHILPMPGPARFVLARLIAQLRSPRARAKYGAIGGKSPLAAELWRLAERVQRSLGSAFLVRHACLYTAPSLETTFRELARAGALRIVAVPVFPQHSRATSQACEDASSEVARRLGVLYCTTSSFPEGEGYIGSLVDRCLSLAAGSDHVALVAHGVPESYIERGDPYLDEITRTATALGNRFEEAGFCWSLCFQSRLGPMRWLGPHVEEELERLGAGGVRALTVVPISFACENLETLFDLDIEAARVARATGITDYRRALTPGLHPMFIDELAGLVRGIVESQEWSGTSGRTGAR